MRLINADLLMNDTESSMLDNSHQDKKVKMNHHNEHMHFLSLITKQPTVETNEWISITEDLPKENETYICTIKRIKDSYIYIYILVN